MLTEAAARTLLVVIAVVPAETAVVVAPAVAAQSISRGGAVHTSAFEATVRTVAVVAAVTAESAGASEVARIALACAAVAPPAGMQDGALAGSEAMLRKNVTRTALRRMEGRGSWAAGLAGARTASRGTVPSGTVTESPDIASAGLLAAQLPLQRL